MTIKMQVCESSYTCTKIFHLASRSIKQVDRELEGYLALTCPPVTPRARCVIALSWSRLTCNYTHTTAASLPLLAFCYSFIIFFTVLPNFQHPRPPFLTDLLFLFFASFRFAHTPYFLLFWAACLVVCLSLTITLFSSQYQLFVFRFHILSFSHLFAFRWSAFCSVLSNLPLCIVPLAHSLPLYLFLS